MQITSDDLPGKSVCDQREVGKSICCSDICNIAGSDLVDGGKDDAFDEVAVFEERMGRVSGNGLSLLVTDQQAVIGQQVKVFVSAYFNTVFLQWRLDHVIDLFGSDAW